MKSSGFRPARSNKPTQALQLHNADPIGPEIIHLEYLLSAIHLAIHLKAFWFKDSFSDVSFQGCTHYAITAGQNRTLLFSRELLWFSSLLLFLLCFVQFSFKYAKYTFHSQFWVECCKQNYRCLPNLKRLLVSKSISMWLCWRCFLVVCQLWFLASCSQKTQWRGHS